MRLKIAVSVVRFRPRAPLPNLTTFQIVPKRLGTLDKTADSRLLACPAVSGRAIAAGQFVGIYVGIPAMLTNAAHRH
jgi:hypothetical protein